MDPRGRAPAGLHFVAEGAGASGLVFVHGFTCAHDDWEAQAEFFRGRYRVIRCDLRGHGRSPGSKADCDPLVYGGDVADLVEAAGLEQAVLVGHSMGCRVVLQAALQSALQSPARVRGIVLVDGSYRATADPAAAIRQAIERAGGFEAHIRRQFGTMFLRETARSRYIIERALRMPADLAESLYARMTAWDGERLEPALSALRVPLLLLQSSMVQPDGLRRALQPEDVVPWIELVRARAHSVAFEIIADAGHFTMIDAADAVNRRIAVFAEQLIGGRSGAN